MSTRNPDSKPSESQRLRQAFRAWAATPWRRHALAVGILTLALAGVYEPSLFQRGPLPDELAYVGAFKAAAAGRSPALSRGYLYFPFLALVGGRLSQEVGIFPVLFGLRLLNLLGLATTLWISLAWLPWRWRWRLLLALAVGALAPAYRLGITYGNLTMAVSGMIVAGLLFWRRRPLLCGSLLGISIAIKPLAPVAVGLLASHRPRGPGRRHQLAAAIAFVSSCGLFFGLPYFGDYLGRLHPDLVSRTLSFHRFPYLLGWRLQPVLLFLLLAFLAFLFVRRRQLSRRHFLAVALAASLAATPLVWSHTLLLSLPMQVLALQVAWWRYRARGALPAREPGVMAALRRFEPLLIFLVVANLQFSVGGNSIDDMGFFLQFFGTLAPALGPAVLTGYLLATTGQDGEPARSGKPG